MFSALDVARYFLSMVSEADGDVMTNLKLQKLLYYAQGFHLAVFDKPLFPEPIEKWPHGPVVAEVYHEYKQHGANRIPYPTEVPHLDERTEELLQEVWTAYGQFAAWTLRNLTHREPPWISTPEGGLMSHKAMKEYFKTQIV